MDFSNSLLNWYLQNKRSLPWRNTKNPYEIWLSEIILQQTKVAQGLPYYELFISTFPILTSTFSIKPSNLSNSWSIRIKLTTNPAQAYSLITFIRKLLSVTACWFGKCSTVRKAVFWGMVTRNAAEFTNITSATRVA